jgi:hypothetical protein
MESFLSFFTQPWIAYAIGVLAALMFLVISKIATGSWIKGLIVGADGKLSTSKCQFWIWTEVVLFSYAFLFTSHVQGGFKPWCPPATANTPPAATAPQTTGPCSGKPQQPPTIPTDLLILMGLSITTAATAKGIASANPGSTAAPTTGDATKTLREKVGTGSGAKYGDLVTDNQSGTVTSFAKVQMLAWTVVGAAAYVVTAIAARAMFFDAVALQYPDVDPALVVLVGLGQGAYLGTKVAAKNGTDV